MKYSHIKNNSNKLLVFFNDMSHVGITNNKFLAFKILNDEFKEYDILFVKDIKTMNWYLSIIDDVYSTIDNIIKTNNYTFMFGLTTSSGALCLLNTLYKFDIFKKSVIINGQTTMCESIVNKYKHTNCNWINIDRQSIGKPFNEELLTPFNQIPNTMLDKYIYYYCNTDIDLIYYEYVKSIYPENLHDNIFFDNTHNTHDGYIEYLLHNKNFLSDIKHIFNESIV